MILFFNPIIGNNFCTFISAMQTQRTCLSIIGFTGVNRCDSADCIALQVLNSRSVIDDYMLSLAPYNQTRKELWQFMSLLVTPYKDKCLGELDIYPTRVV